MDSLTPTFPAAAAAPSAPRTVAPLSYEGESEFNSFLEAAAKTINNNSDSLVHDVSQYVNYINDVPLSSSASDSGHSSDNMEL